MNKSVVKTQVTPSFILKEPKSDETIILFRVSSGRAINMRFSTGYKVNPKFWDKENQKVRNVALVSNSVETNIYLDSLRNNFNKEISNVVNKGEKVTKDVIKEVFNIVSNKKQVAQVEVEKMTFFKFCEKFINDKTKTLPAKRGNKSETVSVYKQAVKHIKEFAESQSYNVDFETIDLEFYHEFIEYMETKEKKDDEYYSANTIGKHIKTLKSILNAATYDGFNHNLKYKHPEFKIISELTTAIFLNNDEIMSMFNLDLSDNPQLEKARDIFILGCETGQRISDYNNFRECEIVTHGESEFFKVIQKKTGNVVYCLITDAMRKIMNDRYEGKPPTPMTEQHINQSIKFVGEKAKIYDEINFERTEGKKKVKTNKYKYEMICTHTARRSFATNSYNSGMNVNDIMVLTGHKTLKEFLKYIREDGKNITAQIINKTEYKNSRLAV